MHLVIYLLNGLQELKNTSFVVNVLSLSWKTQYSLEFLSVEVGLCNFSLDNSNTIALCERCKAEYSLKILHETFF